MKTIPDSILLKLRRNFFAGLFVALPIFLSVWLLYIFFVWITEKTSAILALVPSHELFAYVDGKPKILGRITTFLVTVVLLFLLGVITRSVMGKDILRRTEALIARIPLLNKIYPTVRDISDTFQPDRPSAFREAVLVEFPLPDSYTIGFVTGETKEKTLSDSEEPLVSVFVPTSPNPTTGFLLFLPKRKLTPLKLTVAEAFKLVISGGTAKANADESSLQTKK